jgi:hypothetical protein
VDQTVDDGLGNDRVLEEFEPTLRVDLGSDDERALLVTLFEDVHQGGSLFVGVISETEVIKDEGLGLGKRADVVKVAASSLGGLDLLEEEVNREEDGGVALMAKTFTEGNGKMTFAQAGFAED